MAPNSKPAAGADDTHRKTYDTAEYAAKAAKREADEKEERKARYEAKLAGKKYHAPPPDDAVESSARAARLDVTSLVGKSSLVPAGSGVGKRGRSAGFYCQECDLTFKDNLQWVEHLNSRGHLAKVGESGVVKRATLEDVRERLAWLREKKEREAVVVALEERVKLSGEREEKEREEKREKRREKRRAKKEDGDGVKVEEGAEGDDEMARMMGFGGFGSTKV